MIFVCLYRVLREQWIRAKYERKEFCNPNKNFTYEEGAFTQTHTSSHSGKDTHTRKTQLSFSAGVRDGMLMKRGRDNGQFLSRRFVLSELEGTLKYYTKYDVRSVL